MTKERGYLALVLHAHLPYVRHPEDPDALEHRWLFEAITESYIPLLEMLQGLARDKVAARLTLSVSPTLLAMLDDPWQKDQYRHHLERLLSLAEVECVRTAGDPAFHRLALFYRERFTGIREFYNGCNGDLTGVLRGLTDAGVLEVITCAGTHPFLPLVATDAARRAQIGVAVSACSRALGRPPKGMWLPECGYTPGIGEWLREYGIEYFFVGRSAFDGASPRPVFGTFAPVLTMEGVAAFAGDGDAARQVWSAREGYPGDPDYREYYRDIGFDLDLDTIGPYIHPDGIRLNTGFKYYRVTGAGDHKELYEPDRAMSRVREHAAHFVAERARQTREAAARIGRDPIIVAPFDLELFGHWWYEGPAWLGEVLRRIADGDDGLSTVTPADYLSLYPDYQNCALPMSSWGRGGYAEVWLNETNDWIYPALHQAETRLGALAVRTAHPSGLAGRVLNQAARELMLAQASDWAFIMDARTTVDYAVRRTKRHLNQCMRLCAMAETGRIDEDILERAEAASPIFPDLDFRLYRDVAGPQPGTAEEAESANAMPARSGPRVLMLSWEYPPVTVGGLSRHVYDLSRFLVRAGAEVHVATISANGVPGRSLEEGVRIHRVTVEHPNGGEFIHWMLAFNLALMDRCRALIEDEGLRFDVVHAHDWLVGYAAGYVKERYGLPLAATIHATEHGRNGGIFNELQRQISDIEWRLTYDASRVIVCSTYMRRELQTVFSLPPGKVDVIPNGVDPDNLDVSALTSSNRRFDAGYERVVLYVGRLVREKGVQTLIEAAPAIFGQCEGARIVVIGKGPMMDELRRMAHTFGVQDRVLFTGFVSDQERNAWLRRADVAVFPSLYEPFGIVALEAMAAGIPVVVSDVGGLGDVVEHGRNGLKMNPGDAGSLCAQVCDILLHPERASAFVAAAAQDLRRYDWQLIAGQTVLVYEAVRA